MVVQKVVLLGVVLSFRVVGVPSSQVVEVLAFLVVVRVVLGNVVGGLDVRSGVEVLWNFQK